MDSVDISWEFVNRIYLIQDTDQWSDLVNTAMNFRDKKMRQKIFLLTELYPVSEEVVSIIQLNWVIKSVQSSTERATSDRVAVLCLMITGGAVEESSCNHR
jgi:hypothetical protein